MFRFLAGAVLVLSLSLPAIAANPQASPRAYAPENLSQLSERDQERVISKEFEDQSGGRRIPDDQLEFYLDQVDSGWGFSRIKADIATSLRGRPGNGGWNPGHGGGNVNGRVVRCESVDERSRECQTGFRSRAVVSRQLSRAECIEGRNWGQRPGVIWVNWGCRAEFAEVGGSNSGWENSDYGRYSVTCASNNDRHTTCSWNTRYGPPQLVERVSRANCVEGQSWGYRNGNLWVDRGCRARFAPARNW